MRDDSRASLATEIMEPESKIGIQSFIQCYSQTILLLLLCLGMVLLRLLRGLLLQILHVLIVVIDVLLIRCYVALGAGRKVLVPTIPNQHSIRMP